MPDPLLYSIAAVALWMSAWLCVGILTTDNSWVDVAWGPGFLVVALVATSAAAADGEIGGRLLLIDALIAMWAIRLGLHIGRRKIGHGEDPRYARWREEWGRWVVPRSILQVYLLQGVLLLVVAAPIHVAAADAGGPLDVLAVLGAVIFLVGLSIEAVADRQLDRFIRTEKSPDNPLMTAGLWRYSRHPNYFGEAVLWIGIAVVALGADHGWVGLIGAAVITILVRFVSGVPLVEERFAGRRGWEEYADQTSIFIPLPPAPGRGS